MTRWTCRFTVEQGFEALDAHEPASDDHRGVGAGPEDPPDALGVLDLPEGEDAGQLFPAYLEPLGGGAGGDEEPVIGEALPAHENDPAGRRIETRRRLSLEEADGPGGVKFLRRDDHLRLRHLPGDIERKHDAGIAGRVLVRDDRDPA